MQELPNLSQLDHSAKDELIRFLWSMLEGQAKQIAASHSGNTRSYLPFPKNDLHFYIPFSYAPTVKLDRSDRRESIVQALGYTGLTDLTRSKPETLSFS